MRAEQSNTFFHPFRSLYILPNYLSAPTDYRPPRGVLPGGSSVIHKDLQSISMEETMASTSTLLPLEMYLPLLFFLFLLPLFVILKPKPSKNPPLPPGPKPWPIIGNLPLMGDKPHVAMAQLAKTHGPIISLRLGTQLVIVGSSPAAAAAILKTNDRELSGRHVPHVSFARDPVLNRDSIAWTFECSEEWKSFRALMRSELFGTKIIEAQSNIRETKVHDMVKFLGRKDGKRVRIREVLFVNTFNSLANIYMSKDFIGFEGGESERVGGLVRNMMELWTAPNISDLFPVLGGLDLQGLKSKADGCVKKMCGVWDSTIKERRQSNGGDHLKKNRDFLDVLIDSGFSDDQISLLFVELLAAVSDSSTATVEWAMTELIRTPETLNKLKKELMNELSQSFVRESNLANLPYLHACVKEILRLHPPAPLLLPHRAIEDCQVLNYTIPKDAQVYVNVWAIARDPTIWEDPLSFKPERFLSSHLDYKGNEFEYLPFGSGRKICAGLPMAMRLVQLALASLIQNFEWNLPHDMSPQDLDNDEKFGVTLQKLKPLEVIPKQIIRN